MDVDSSTSDPWKGLIGRNDAHKTRFPSSSPFVRTASSTPVVDEAVSLLNKFKKPNPSGGSRTTTTVRGRTAELPASSSSFVTAPDKAVPLHRRSSVVSQRSSVSATSRKRKAIHLSDEEQDNTTTSASSITVRKKPASRVKLPIVKPVAKLKGPPASKKISGIDLRTKTSSTTSSKPSISHHVSIEQPACTGPTAHTHSNSSTQEKVRANPPSKRKAAVRARLELRKLADEPFGEGEIVRTIDRQRACNDGKTADLGKRMRILSITPAPAESGSGETTVEDESEYKRETFLKDRAKGRDRLANRTLNIEELIGDDSDDDYEDLDTSEFFYSGGVLFKKGQENRLTEL